MLLYFSLICSFCFSRRAEAPLSRFSFAARRRAAASPPMITADSFHTAAAMPPPLTIDASLSPLAISFSSFIEIFH
jgi:hypothetical protein